jgi:hypothetical protein
MFQSLLNNKALWLAVLALVQTLALNYFGVPQDVWQAINLILLTLIGALTIDGATKQVVAEIRAYRADLKASKK